jgi:uncharacterized protein (DUF885 family)
MTHAPRRLRATAVVAAAVCVSACATSPPQAREAAAAGAAIASQPESPVTRLNAIYENYFEDLLRLVPTMATWLGDERYNDRLENTASAAFSQEYAALNRRYLETVRSIDPATLTGSDRISYDVFVRERELALAEQRFPGYLLPVDQMDSMASTLALFGSGAAAQPFRNAADYDHFLTRSGDFIVWVDTAIASMREGMRRGITQPRAVIVKVLPQLREIANPDPEKTVFWNAIRAMPDSISAADRERITARWRNDVTTRIVPAYLRLADFIEKEYAPAARTSVGWSALPDGAEWYRHQIRKQTTTDLTAEEIHALGLAEVARIRAEMEAVKKQVGFDGDLAAFFRYLQTDPKFYFTRSEDVLQGYVQLKQRIDALLPKLFSDFPKAQYEVRAVEPFRAASAAGGSYQPPSADGKRPGIFYVNTYNLKAQPIFGMETLSLHEAAPGHHFQIAIQQELSELPRFRRFNGYVAYAEGWALYAESIGKELGLFTDPYQWYGRLSDEMLRAMRLVVDTGLHAKGWSREQAIQYMTDNSSMVASDIEAEVERYIVWPGQALGYKVGQLRITAMRARAEAALGPRFDVRAFHSQVLRDGALPLAVLEAKIDRWVATQKALTASADTTDRR